MIHAEVVFIVWGQISKLFGSINTAKIEFFDDRYVALSKVAAAMGIRGGELSSIGTSKI